MVASIDICDFLSLNFWHIVCLCSFVVTIVICVDWLLWWSFFKCMSVGTYSLQVAKIFAQGLEIALLLI